jgi:hypothetical protein
MRSFRNEELSVLMDMLATHTERYLQMQNGGSTEKEYAECSLTIKAIQAEIDFRKQTTANTSTTDSNIILPND